MVYDRGVNKTDLARNLGLSRQSLYQIFTRKSVPFRLLRKAGELLRYDFADHVPELNTFPVPDSDFSLVDVSKLSHSEHIALLERERKSWRDKYIAALEQINHLLFELSDGKTAEQMPEK